MPIPPALPSRQAALPQTSDYAQPPARRDGRVHVPTLALNVGKRVARIMRACFHLLWRVLYMIQRTLQSRWREGGGWPCLRPIQRRTLARALADAVFIRFLWKGGAVHAGQLLSGCISVYTGSLRVPVNFGSLYKLWACLLTLQTAIRLWTVFQTELCRGGAASADLLRSLCGGGVRSAAAEPTVGCVAHAGPPHSVVRPAATAETASIPAGPTCGMCFGTRVQATALPCGHVYCWVCSIRWVCDKVRPPPPPVPAGAPNSPLFPTIV